ncbi:MAG: CPBP family intramembrane metalloprotease [Methylococcales bacterium]
MNIKSRNILPIINGAAFTSCAVFNLSIFDYVAHTTLLTGLMISLPFIDRSWSIPELDINKTNLVRWLLCISVAFLLITVNPDYASAALGTLLLTALPEEWFFRGYFLIQIEKAGLRANQANIITSLFFTLLHLPTQGLIGLSVFIPSIIYGYVYQKTQDIVLVILLHAISNIIFFIFIL